MYGTFSESQHYTYCVSVLKVYTVFFATQWQTEVVRPCSTLRH